MYSRVYKIGDKSFRYNFETKVLEYYKKPSKSILAEMEKDNEEWIKKFNKPLWNAEELAGVIDSISLCEESWKEDPEYWCGMYASQIDWELKAVEKEFI